MFGFAQGAGRAWMEGCGGTQHPTARTGRQGNAGGAGGSGGGSEWRRMAGSRGAMTRSTMQSGQMGVMRRQGKLSSSSACAPVVPAASTCLVEGRDAQSG